MKFTVTSEGYVISDTGSISELETNENGSIAISGLQTGTYYLKETKALTDYIITDNPLTITINGESDIADGTQDMVIHTTVDNHKTYELPETGSTGTRFYTAAGTAMLISSAALYEYSKKRKRKGGD